MNDWTLSQHIISYNILKGALDNKAPVKILYVDFAKAFDAVSVHKLIIKLKHYEIFGSLLSCVISFLSNRFQKVKLVRVFQIMIHSLVEYLKELSLDFFYSFYS